MKNYIQIVKDTYTKTIQPDSAILKNPLQIYHFRYITWCVFIIHERQYLIQNQIYVTPG